MKIRVISTGTTEFEPVHEVGAPAIAAALSGESGEDVASTITDYTNYERSNISHDDYVTVTEDDGTPLWSGWLGGIDAPPPGDALAQPGEPHPPAPWCTCEPGAIDCCEYRMLADAVEAAINVNDGDEAEVALLITAVEGVGALLDRYTAALKTIAERDPSALPRSFRDIARDALSDGGDDA